MEMVMFDGFSNFLEWKEEEFLIIALKETIWHDILLSFVNFLLGLLMIEFG